MASNLTAPTRMLSHVVQGARPGPTLWVLGFLLVLAIATYLRGPFIIVNTLVTGSAWALVAVGLSLIFGVMNVLNLAQGAFFMVGTLSSYLAYTWMMSGAGFPIAAGLVPPAAIGFALVVGFAMGVLIDLCVFRPLRRRSDERWVFETIVVTLGISVVLMGAHQLFWGANLKGIGNYWSASHIRFLGTSLTWDQVTTFIVSLVTIALLGWALKRTKAGRAARAVAQDERGAAMVGININRVHTLTFGVGTAIATLAGGTLLHLYPSTPTVGDTALGIAFTVVILAGLGNVVGAIPAGFIIAFIQGLTASFVGASWIPVVTFSVIIVVLIFRPQGLLGQQVRGVWEQ